nr:MAG TPA: General secretion pathway protein G polymer, bacterial secretion, cryo-EM [Caudoviricetes sp.]
MTVIDVVGVALMFAVSVAVIVPSFVTARSECRTNRELLRVQREWMERMTDDKRN